MSPRLRRFPKWKRPRNQKPLLPTQAILYARVSSKEQEREGFSIPAQRQLLNDYAQRHGFRVVQEFIDVETAKAAGRTQFQEMVRFLQSHRAIKTLLVEKTDRLYRNFRGLRDPWKILDLEIHLVKEGEVLSKDSRSHVKVYPRHQSAHGEKLRIDNLSEEVKKGMRQKIEQGGLPGKGPNWISQ